MTWCFPFCQLLHIVTLGEISSSWQSTQAFHRYYGSPLLSLFSLSEQQQFCCWEVKHSVSGYNHVFLALLERLVPAPRASQSPRFIIGPLLINPCNFRLIVISISIGPCLLLSFTAFCKLPYLQTLVSGNESESFIAFRKSPVCCRSMNIKRQFLVMNPTRSSRFTNRPFVVVR